MLNFSDGSEQINNALLLEVVGGDDVLNLMARRMAGESWRRIAYITGGSRMGCWKRVRRAKNRLRRCGLLTPAMEKKL